MTGQLDLFTSLERGRPDSGHLAPVETAPTPGEGADSPVSPSRSGDTCDECGSQADVMFGCCRACFDAWKAAA